MLRQNQKSRSLFLIPEPKYIKYGTVNFCLNFDGRVASNVRSTLLATVVDGLFGSRGRVVGLNKKAIVRCAIVNPKEYGLRPKKREFLGNKDAYYLEAGSDGVTILAREPTGLNFGLITLGQLMKNKGEQLPELVIVDWPLLTHRGYMLALVQGHNTYLPEYAKHVVREIAKLKFNVLYLYLENSFQFPFDSTLGGKRSITPKQACELDAFAAAYGIEVIPMLNVLGHAAETLHLERYRYLGEYPEGENLETYYVDQFCPSNQETLELVKRQIDVLIKCFRSNVIHVGGDEAANLGKCPRCKKVAARKGIPWLFANYFNTIQRYAKFKGKRIGIWGDMLLHHRPGCASKESIHTADFMNRDIIIYDWHYAGGSSETLRYFARRGYDVVACSSTHVFYCNSVCPEQEINQRLLFKDCPRAVVKAGLITNWTNYLGAHDENFWLLVSSGADIMWSCRSERRKDMLSAFALQRYDLTGSALPRYLISLGSTQGDFYNVFGVMNNTDLRQTLYHTDNPLKFWHHYNKILTPPKVVEWDRAIRAARKLWNSILKEDAQQKKDFLPFLEAPLLIHEHLYKRYQMISRLRKLYGEAALLQNCDPRIFSQKLLAAAAIVEEHTRDFIPLDRMLNNMTKILGIESCSLFRLSRTRKNIKALAKFLRYLSNSPRPLPAFIDLHDVFFERKMIPFWADREDEWGMGPEQFVRYSVVDIPWRDGPWKIDNLK